jgi:hypothetical protein
MVEAKQPKLLCSSQQVLQVKMPLAGQKDKIKPKVCKMQAWVKAPTDLLQPFGIEEYSISHLCPHHAYDEARQKQQELLKGMSKEEGDAMLKDEKILVVCPLEKNNYMPQGTLEKHLKTCPKAKQIKVTNSQPFYNPKVNMRVTAASEGKLNAAFSELDDEAIMELIEAAYEAAKAEFGESASELFKVDKQVE